MTTTTTAHKPPTAQPASSEGAYREALDERTQLATLLDGPYRAGPVPPVPLMLGAGRVVNESGMPFRHAAARQAIASYSAYEVLSHSERRGVYDLSLRDEQPRATPLEEAASLLVAHVAAARSRVPTDGVEQGVGEELAAVLVADALGRLPSAVGAVATRVFRPSDIPTVAAYTAVFHAITDRFRKYRRDPSVLTDLNYQISPARRAGSQLQPRVQEGLRLQWPVEVGPETSFWTRDRGLGRGRAQLSGPGPLTRNRTAPGGKS